MIEWLDYTALRFWMDVGQTVATVAIGIYVWWNKHRAKIVKRFAELESWRQEHVPRVDAMETAVKEMQEKCSSHQNQTGQLDRGMIAVQAELRHLPGKKEIDMLTRQIGDMNEKMGRMDGRLAGINRAVDLMNQHLLKVDL
ncbi:hypothetical protein [Desulfobulbus elongatus]|uniref:hypothetical protein n=1 Tax=Desulfobulbus elongatus TaxID=53332 RepID=UPI000489D3DF|nr:hypothetical protein [Desulfobulbus elongatus]